MPPKDSGSVTQWLGALQGGDLGAAQPLWERYFARLVRLAQARLRARRGPGAAEDEEDAALRSPPWRAPSQCVTEPESSGGIDPPFGAAVWCVAAGLRRR